MIRPEPFDPSTSSGTAGKHKKIITNKISDVNVFISNSRSIITYRRR